MGSFANSLFKIMLGWLQAVVSAVWSAFTNENGSSLFNWIGRNWILIAGFLCVIGLAADLCVYILRWKPFRVWKSFFSRARDTDDSNTRTEPAGKHPSEEKLYATQRTNQTQFGYAVRPNADNRLQPDLSQWEPKNAEYDAPVQQSAAEPATVTNAGYVVPADSPYRRPARKTPETGHSGPEPDLDMKNEKKDDRPVSLAPRRRHTDQRQ